MSDLTQVRYRATMAERRELQLAAAREGLRLAIKAALAEGYSTREVARAAGVSQPRIVQIAQEA